MQKPSQRSRCGPPWDRRPSSHGAGPSTRRTSGRRRKLSIAGSVSLSSSRQTLALARSLSRSLSPYSDLSDDAVRQRARGRVATGLEGEVKAVLGPGDAAVDVVAVDGQRPVPDGEGRARKGGLDGQPSADLLGAAEPAREVCAAAAALDERPARVEVV